MYDERFTRQYRYEPQTESSATTHEIYSLKVSYHVPRVVLTFKPTMTHKARNITRNKIKTRNAAPKSVPKSAPKSAPKSFNYIDIV